jgi:hypothetical protein
MKGKEIAGAIHQDDEKGIQGLGKKCGRVKPPLFLPVEKSNAGKQKRPARGLLENAE